MLQLIDRFAIKIAITKQITYKLTQQTNTHTYTHSHAQCEKEYMFIVRVIRNFWIKRIARKENLKKEKKTPYYKTI
jgi:DNA polymerase elongation subunit (family B)